MPRPQLPDGLYVSVSQIKCWLRCPRQYELHYIRGVEPAFTPVALAFGSAIHAALAAHYREIKASGQLLPRDLVLDVFRGAWDFGSSGPVPLQEDEDDDLDMAQVTDRGVGMLCAFYDHASTTAPPLVCCVEQSFAVEIADPVTGELVEEQLIGAIDLVIQEDGHRVVVEHKTAAKKYSADQLRYDIQPTAYGLAARQMDLGEVGLRYQVLTKTKTPTVQVEDVHRDAQDEDDFLRTVGAVLRAIDTGVSYPVRGWACRSCAWAHACRGRS